MKLNTKAFRYLTPEDWRVLTAVEMGSKNHEVVPTQLITQLAHLHAGGTGVNKCISTLAKTGLIAKVRNVKYDGYRLTYGGLDYLALHAHTKSSSIIHLGSQMGVGKESDIYLVTTPSSTSGPQQQPEQAILKLHRIGRTSFRTTSNNRAYGKGRAHCTWQYLSRLSAQKEFAAMTALRDAGFRVPRPIAWNRHAVVMGLVPGTPLKDVPLSAFGEVDDSPDAATQRRQRDKRIAALYDSLMQLTLDLAACGVIHGDFNEFNILIEGYLANDDHDDEDDASKPRPLTPWLIDFPQITALTHPSADFYFDRDVQCIKTFFRKRYHFETSANGPTIQDAQQSLRAAQKDGGRPRLDVQIEAAGFSRKMAKELEQHLDQTQSTTTEGEPASSGAEEDTDDGSEDRGHEERGFVTLQERDDSQQNTSTGTATAEDKATETAASSADHLPAHLDALSMANSQRTRPQAKAKAAAGWSI